MAGFEALMKQVRAVSTVTHSMGTHVGGLFSGMLTGQMASPALRSSMVLAHIRLLAALMDQVPSMAEYDFDIVIGAGIHSEGPHFDALMRNTERVTDELEMIQDIIHDLREAIAEVSAELYALRNIASQIGQLTDGLHKESQALEESRRELEATVIPEVEQLLKTLDNLLLRYEAEFKTRDFRLWQLNRVMRFRLPFMRGIKEKRRAKARKEKEEEERKQLEEEEKKKKGAS